MDRVVFLTIQEIHFHQYFDFLDTDDTGLCTILFMSIRVQFSHHTCLYLRMYSHQIVSIWNRYETGTDKPCAYMGPADSL